MKNETSRSRLNFDTKEVMKGPKILKSKLILEDLKELKERRLGRANENNVIHIDK